MQTRSMLAKRPQLVSLGENMRVSMVKAVTFVGACCLLSACNRNPDSAQSLEEAEAQVQANAAEDGRIACATGGATSFTPSCTVERDTSEGALMLTIRHADGGFRRFRVEPGKGVAVADGAEAAVVTPVGPKQIEVIVGGDKYRLPATVKGNTPAAAPAKTSGPAAVPAA